MKKELAMLFTGIALAGSTGCGILMPSNTPGVGNNGKVEQGTVLNVAGLNDSITVTETRLTENGLSARDYTLGNPYDLAPVDKIIAQAIEDELTVMPKDQVLVVLSGEAHEAVADKMVHIGVLTHLAQMRDKNNTDSSRKFLFATEMQSNYLSIRYWHENLKAPFDTLKNLHTRYDPDYKFAVRTEAAYSQYANAGRSEEKIFQAVLKLDIPVVFNDADHEEYAKFINVTQGLNGQVYKDLRPELTASQPQEELDMVEADGMAVRNGVMVRRAMEFAANKGLRIIFQKCGSDHVFGNVKEGSSFLHSLAVQYRKAGARVLAIYPSHSSAPVNSVVDRKVWMEFPNTIVFRGVAQEDNYNSFTFRRSALSESEFIKKLAKSYGSGKAPFDFEVPYNRNVIRMISNELQELIDRDQKSILPSFYPAYDP